MRCYVRVCLSSSHHDISNRSTIDSEEEAFLSGVFLTKKSDVKCWVCKHEGWKNCSFRGLWNPFNKRSPETSKGKYLLRLFKTQPGGPLNFRSSNRRHLESDREASKFTNMVLCQFLFSALLVAIFLFFYNSEVFLLISPSIAFLVHCLLILGSYCRPQCLLRKGFLTHQRGDFGQWPCCSNSRDVAWRWQPHVSVLPLPDPKTPAQKSFSKPKLTDRDAAVRESSDRLVRLCKNYIFANICLAPIYIGIHSLKWTLKTWKHQPLPLSWSCSVLS